MYVVMGAVVGFSRQPPSAHNQCTFNFSPIFFLIEQHEKLIEIYLESKGISWWI
jgi:hypothetical protein